MTSQEFASFLYDVQLRAVMYDREGLGLMSVPALHSWLLRDASLGGFNLHRAGRDIGGK